MVACFENLFFLTNSNNRLTKLPKMEFDKLQQHVVFWKIYENSKTNFPRPTIAQFHMVTDQINY